jgi:hypothetical protein
MAKVNHKFSIGIWILVVVLILISGCITRMTPYNKPYEEISGISSPEHSEVKTEAKGNLGVYYFQTRELDIADFNVAYTRLVIPWGAVEPEQGKFLWDAKPLKRIDMSLAKGIKVIPVIRTVGAGWALKTQSQSCSSPPKDLTKTFNENYGYSKSYYHFISEVARHYKGKFQIVVIENEVTAKNFWCGSMNEYLRLVATARKAFKDVDPNVKIADSGIPSTVLGFLITKELLDRGKEKEAFDFYNAYFNLSFVRKVNSVEELKITLEEKHAKESVEKAEYLLGRVNNAVDIINFHYYESSEFFPEVVSFIKKRTGDMPLMSNEMGTRYRLDEPEREKKAGEDMIKKFVLARALNLESVIWFPFSNNRHNIIGLMDENKKEIDATLNAFNTSMNFLNRPLLSYENLSENGIE